ncbi:MAG: hypothetical protein FWJ90_13945 [Actinomadura sp.]
MQDLPFHQGHRFRHQPLGQPDPEQVGLGVVQAAEQKHDPIERVVGVLAPVEKETLHRLVQGGETPLPAESPAHERVRVQPGIAFRLFKEQPEEVAQAVGRYPGVHEDRTQIGLAHAGEGGQAELRQGLGESLPPHCLILRGARVLRDFPERGPKGVVLVFRGGDTGERDRYARGPEPENAQLLFERRMPVRSVDRAQSSRSLVAQLRGDLALRDE